MRFTRDARSPVAAVMVMVQAFHAAMNRGGVSPVEQGAETDAGDPGGVFERHCRRPAPATPGAANRASQLFSESPPAEGPAWR